MINLKKDETSNSESETNNDFDSETEIDQELNNFFIQNSSPEN